MPRRKNLNRRYLRRPACFRTCSRLPVRCRSPAIPKHEDTETTLAELKQRIAKTVDFLQSVKASQLEGAESRPIEIKTPNRTLNFTGLSYLNQFVLPNFYFHESISYAILRHNGVEVGKSDYLGAM